YAVMPTAATKRYTRSLHDALPISAGLGRQNLEKRIAQECDLVWLVRPVLRTRRVDLRSDERASLSVCRPGRRLIDFEIGQILHLKSRNFEISRWTRHGAGSNVRFLLSDLRCRVRPISKCLSRQRDSIKMCTHGGFYGFQT